MNTASSSEPKQDQLEQSPNARVLRIRHGIVNSYLVGNPGSGEWALVDAGLTPASAGAILDAAGRRFGPEVKPASIILTHGHFDHVGGLRRLVSIWKVPVYAHELELPYLTGRSSYPPPDSTVGGGFMARMAGLFPRGPINLGDSVHALPEDGIVPGLPGWRWIHTPGHSPGHISLFRFSDRMLITGDAFVTVHQESLWDVLIQRQQLSGPPAYFTPDWEAARRSVETLAQLDPEVAATGHGVPMGGPRLREELQALAANFERRAVPKHGRYVRVPALADSDGVISVPPPVTNPRPMVMGLTMAGLAALATLLWVNRRRSHLSSHRVNPSANWRGEIPRGRGDAAKPRHVRDPESRRHNARSRW